MGLINWRDACFTLLSESYVVLPCLAYGGRIRWHFCLPAYMHNGDCVKMTNNQKEKNNGSEEGSRVVHKYLGVTSHIC